MRWALWLAAGACWLAGNAVGLAGQWDPKDRAPWHLQIVAKADHAQPSLKSDTAADSGRLRYLHVQLDFRPDLGHRKLHQFRVVDKDGKTVADVLGYHRDRSLLVFEGDWKGLQGLYLDGLEHREPLFSEARDRATSPDIRAGERTPGRVTQPTRTVASPSVAVASSPGAVARSPDLATRSTEGLQQPMGDLRSSAPAGSGDPRRAQAASGDLREAPSSGASGTGQGAASDARRTSGVAGRAGDASGAGAADNGRSPSRDGTGSGRGKGEGAGGSGGSGSGSGAGSGGSSGNGSGTATGGAGGGAGGGSGTSQGAAAGPTNRVRDAANGADRDAEAESVGPGRTASAGPIGGVGGGGGGMAGGAGRIRLRDQRSDAEFKSPPPMILYLSCTDDLGRGRIYQVDEHGVIRGLVTLPYAATGLAIHRQPALVASVPREGGKVLRIDAVGKVSVILEDDPLLPQPVDVGVAANSDAIVVGDNLAHVLAGTSMDGRKVREYRRFALQKWDRPAMSVALTADKHVLFSTDMEPGVYRYGPDDFSPRPPLLPKLGGVAADTASLRWAAAQPPTQIVVFEGDSPARTLRLPANRIAYRHGLLSFAPASRLVAAAKSVDKADSGVWMVELAAKDGSARDLFAWRKEPILDFVVGPRMPWQPYEPDKRRSLY